MCTLVCKYARNSYILTIWPRQTRQTDGLQQSSPFWAKTPNQQRKQAKQKESKKAKEKKRKGNRTKRKRRLKKKET